MIESALITIALTLLILLSALESHLERGEDDRSVSLGLVRALLALTAATLLLGIGSSWYWSIALILGYPIAQRIGSRLSGVLGSRLNTPEGLVTLSHRILAPFRVSPVEIIEEYEQELLDSVEEFSETVVREVMVPRVDMEVVDSEASLEHALSIFVSTGYSRLPVIGKGIDDVVGVLYLKDLARITHQDPGLLERTSAANAARAALFTPESISVSDLLQQMQRAKTQIAIVSDEYGGVAGMATIEDLIEELVGEIVDEYDKEDLEIEDLGEGSYRVSPRVTLDELSEHCELELEDEDVDTVGGLLIKQLGELPKGGEQVSALGLELVAERVDAKRGRLLSVLVRKLDA